MIDQYLLVSPEMHLGHNFVLIAEKKKKDKDSVSTCKPCHRGAQDKDSDLRVAPVQLWIQHN